MTEARHKIGGLAVQAQLFVAINVLDTSGGSATMEATEVNK